MGGGSWIHLCLMPTCSHRPSPAPSGLPRAEGPGARPPTELPLSTSPHALSPPVKTAPPAPLSGSTTSGASTPPQAGRKSSAVSSGVGGAGAGSRLKPEAPLTRGKSPPSVGQVGGTGCQRWSADSWTVGSWGHTRAPAPVWPQGSRGPERRCDAPRSTQHRRLGWKSRDRLPARAPSRAPEGGPAAGGWGGAQPFPADSPFPRVPPSMTRLPAPRPGPSASTQEGQEEGPAGWRGRLRPVGKRSPAER